MARDYAYETLAEVTSTDMNVGRGSLNAALRDIRKMEPAVASAEDSYILSDLIHGAAKQYRQVFPDAALTPTALAKHWTRLPEEAKKLTRGGTNLHAEVRGPALPQNNRERNMAALEDLKKTLWPS